MFDFKSYNLERDKQVTARLAVVASVITQLDTNNPNRVKSFRIDWDSNEDGISIPVVTVELYEGQ